VFHLGYSLGVFAWAIIAALPLGMLFGWLAAILLNYWQEKHLSYELSMSLVMIYAVFLIAEEILHISGVIAVLMAAITFCRYRIREQGSYEEIERVVKSTDDIDGFWDYLAMIANGILFFSLGATTGLHDFSEVPLIAVAVAIVSLIIARCVVVYGGSLLLARVKHQLSIQWQDVLMLGGLRGAVSAALILMIPESYPHKGTFLCLFVSMIIFTLTVQPVLLKMYLKKNDI
jgi:CPA1 family monovalent cation:H+ antiporter